MTATISDVADGSWEILYFCIVRWFLDGPLLVPLAGSGDPALHQTGERFVLGSAAPRDGLTGPRLGLTKTILKYVILPEGAGSSQANGLGQHCFRTSLLFMPGRNPNGP